MQAVPHKSNFQIFPTETSLYDEMIFIRGGEFMMGSIKENSPTREKPTHKVHLESFMIGKYLVTQALWIHIMGNNPSFFQGNQRPVEQVSWQNTKEFIRRLSELSGRNFRLPTEAEWEFAARGGRFSKGYVYAGSDNLFEVGWHQENSHNQSKPVGLKSPNELGLHDMSGNVFEWCYDWYNPNYYQYCVDKGLSINPKGPKEGGNRVIRGGGWGNDNSTCRISDRDRDDPRSQSIDIGFRLGSV